MPIPRTSITASPVQVMRLIDNDHVEPDVVDDSLKETIEYFIDEYSDAEEFDPYLLDEEIYEDLPLDLLKTELLVQVSSKSLGVVAS